jgi:hypothetical protein
MFEPLYGNIMLSTAKRVELSAKSEFSVEAIRARLADGLAAKSIEDRSMGAYMQVAPLMRQAGLRPPACNGTPEQLVQMLSQVTAARSKR